MSEILAKVKELVAWMDAHPRTGWYIAVMVTVNFLWQIAQAFV